MYCDECSAHLEVGYWPWCPHGKPPSHRPFHAYEDAVSFLRPKEFRSAHDMDLAAKRHGFEVADKPDIKSQKRWEQLG